MSEELHLLSPSNGEQLLTWQRCCSELQGDIYHCPEYVRLYAGEGKARCVLFRCQAGVVLYPIIERPVDIDGTRTEYRDLTTPYGYGGPVVRPVCEASREELFARFLRSFDGVCSERGIVSEFIRFHPLMENARLYPHRDLTRHHSTVVVDLSLPKLQMWREIRKGHKSSIKKARRLGVRIVLDEPERYLSDFVKLYQHTMCRQGADASYLLSREFFCGILEVLGDGAFIGAALLDGRVVSAAIFLTRPPHIHYHYSGSSQEGLGSCANHALLYDVIEAAGERGLRFLHLGGGLSPGDSLYRFKAGFSPLRREFFTGRRIHNRNTYDELVRARFPGDEGVADHNESFFPLYRAPLTS